MAQPKYWDAVAGEWKPLTVGVTGPAGPQGAPGVDGVDGADGTSGVAVQPAEPASTDLLWVDTDDSYTEPGDWGRTPAPTTVLADANKYFHPLYGAINTGLAAGRLHAWPVLIHPAPFSSLSVGIRVMTAALAGTDVLGVGLYRMDGSDGLYTPSGCTREWSGDFTSGLDSTGNKSLAVTDWPAHEQMVWRWLTVRVPSTNAGAITLRGTSSPGWTDLSYADGRVGIAIANTDLANLAMPDVMPTYGLMNSPTPSSWGPSITPQPRLSRG